MATSNAHDATLLLDFNPWFFNTFISQFKQIVGAPGLYSTHMILDQYSSISRTPFGSNPDVQNEYHWKDAIKAGCISFQVEAYCSKVGGTQKGPFDLRKVEPAEEGVVTVDCIRKLGAEEKVVATWKIVKKMG